MKGINPFILNLVILMSISALIIVPYLLMSSLLMLFIALILFISLVGYVYSFIKVEGTNKGKFIYKPKLSKIIHYDSLMVILFGTMLILFYKGIIPILLIIPTMILYDIFRYLGHYTIWKPPIKVYERGIVLGNTAFYSWDELNINEEGEEIKIKIKYIPKEIVLDKNVLEGVNYERN
jgi:hypothetical protein